MAPFVLLEALAASICIYYPDRLPCEAPPESHPAYPFPNLRLAPPVSARESLPGPIAPIAQLNPERVFALIDRVLPFEVCLYHQVLPIEIQGDQIVLGIASEAADLSYVQRMLAHLHYRLVYQPIDLATQQQLLSAFLSHDYQRKAEGYVEPTAPLSPTVMVPGGGFDHPSSPDPLQRPSPIDGASIAGPDDGAAEAVGYPTIEVSDCLVELQPLSPPADRVDSPTSDSPSTEGPDSADPIEDLLDRPFLDQTSTPSPLLATQITPQSAIVLGDWPMDDRDSANQFPECAPVLTDTAIVTPPSQATAHPEQSDSYQKEELGEPPRSLSLASDRASEQPMDTVTNYAVVTTSDLGTEAVSTDLPAELAQLEQALVQALERPTSAAHAEVPSASEIEAAWVHPTASVPLEWVDLNPSPLSLHTRYDDRPLSELGGLPPRSLMQELLQRAIEGGIGRLYFDRPELDRARILCSRDGILQAALDPLPPSTFQGVIDELKLLANLPLLPPVGKARQVEIERIYRNELLLLRLRIAPGRLGEEATLQVLRGAALKFHQRQQLTKLSQDAIDLTRQLQKKLAEMQVRASLSQDFNPRAQELAQLQVAVQRLVERLAGWRS